MAKPTKQTYTFETKLVLIQRCLAGESPRVVAQHAGLSSPAVLQNWLRIYRAQGEDGLRPKPKGRPAKKPDEAAELSGVERLRREVEYLRAENAYLGKLRALMEEKRRTR